MDFFCENLSEAKIQQGWIEAKRNLEWNEIPQGWSVINSAEICEKKLFAKLEAKIQQGRIEAKRNPALAGLRENSVEICDKPPHKPSHSAFFPHTIISLSNDKIIQNKLSDKNHLTFGQVFL